jgi:hypothetical protein
MRRSASFAEPSFSNNNREKVAKRALLHDYTPDNRECVSTERQSASWDYMI